MHKDFFLKIKQDQKYFFKTYCTSSLEDLEMSSHLLAYSDKVRVELLLQDKAFLKVNKAANLVEKIVKNSSAPIYGVNTGFGFLSNQIISKEQLFLLQENLMKSHCCGIGEYLPRDIVAMMWLLRLNTFSRGYSGIRSSTILHIISVLNSGILGCVPSRGSVGASGDLSPAAHAALPLIEECMCSIIDEGKIQYVSSSFALEKYGLNKLTLAPKEGLSLINGVHLTTALTIKAYFKSESLLELANLVAAMSLYASSSSNQILRKDVLATYNQPGVSQTGLVLADWLDAELRGYPIGKEIQDPYSFRCIPQIHGSVYDALAFVKTTLMNELNTIHDNPLVLVDSGDVVSCGNFHGIYMAKMLDTLSLNLISLASCSERRINQFMNFSSRNLPVFLIANPGVNSGMMMLHTTAVALLSEATSLAYPASVDNIPTNCDQEDHVSMGPIAGYKFLHLADLMKKILAIELLVSCQAADFINIEKMPAKLSKIHKLVRNKVDFLESDRVLSDDLIKILELVDNKFHRLSDCLKF